MTEIGNLDILKLISEMGDIMSEGEVFQLTKCGDINLTQEEYSSIIEKKTAVLISASCAAGAILESAPPEKINALAQFGKDAGMAFQITDDVLDYMAKGNEFGKSIGKDLEEGKITLPLILALRQSTAEEKDIISAIITRKKCTKKEAGIILDLIKKYNGIDDSLKIAEGYINQAKSHLNIFSSCPEKDHLNTVADYILSRNT